VLGAIVGGIAVAMGAVSNCDSTVGDIALGVGAGAGTEFLTGGVSVAGTLLASVERNELCFRLGNAAGELHTGSSVDSGQVRPRCHRRRRRRARITAVARPR